MKKTLVKVIIAALAVVLAVGMCVGMTACNKKQYLFGKETVSLNAQIDVLTNMSKGSADVGVMDSVMAGYYMSNSSYKDTMEVLPFYLSEEEYGIGAKKGNNALMSKINEGLIALAANGKMATIANQFGLGSEVLVKSDTVNPLADANDASWSQIMTEKKLIIGYTVFAPIAYTENNVFTGYDIELAREVIKYLNNRYSAEVEVEFIEIEWDTKETLLENGSIDLVWNGMTINDERIAGMSMSIPYLANKQAIIIMKEDKKDYDLSSLAAFKASASKVIVAVEAGSAAEDLMIIKK